MERLPLYGWQSFLPLKKIKKRTARCVLPDKGTIRLVRRYLRGNSGNFDCLGKSGFSLIRDKTIEKRLEIRSRRAESAFAARHQCNALITIARVVTRPFLTCPSCGLASQQACSFSYRAALLSTLRVYLRQTDLLCACRAVGYDDVHGHSDLKIVCIPLSVGL